MINFTYSYGMHVALKKQINAFQSFIYSNNFDIVAITETWLSDHIYTNEIIHSGYTVIRKDRDGRGGGVLLALKDCFKFTQLPSPNELEIISAEVGSSFTICLIYRPPNSSDQHNSLMMFCVTSLDSTKDF